MLAKRLSKNGTIGIFCPSHVADIERYRQNVDVLTRLGFKVKLGANIYKDTWGFVASAEERASDLNALVSDDEVEMILFGGGNDGTRHGVIPIGVRAELDADTHELIYKY